MKNATHYCAGPAYYRMCSTDVYCSKQTGSSSTKGNHHPSFLRFWNWARKHLMQLEICSGAENVKARNPANIRKWIAPVLLAQAFILRWKRVCIAHNNCGIHPSILSNSIALVNILLGSFQLFLHSDQPLSEGEIIPFSGVCQSRGKLHYPRRRRWWLHALTDRLL